MRATHWLPPPAEPSSPTRLPGLCLGLFLALLAGCDRQPQQTQPAPPQVTTLTVAPQPATMTSDLVGEVRALREVELRPQVSGWIERQLFEPGQEVKEGDVLFVIDSRQYEQNVIDARANVASAEAALARARQDVTRYTPLLPDNAIPRATYDRAVAEQKAAEAALASSHAALARSRLDLANTTVRSPLTGQIGLQQLEVGALATAGQTVLATVSTLDPVLVYFSIPEAELIRFIRKYGAGEAGRKEAATHPVALYLPDGSRYSREGHIDFTERAIATTGTLTVRARFPNSGQVLRPGMNVRLRVFYDEIPEALLVPQRAVTELLGKQFITVVGEGNEVAQRPVRLGERIGAMWLVEEGLRAGEQIVVDGLQKAAPGTVVTPKPLASVSPGNE